MKSLKKEIFKKAIIVILLMIMFFGLSISLFFYQYQIKNVFNLLKIENSDISNYVTAYFKKFYIEVEYLSRLKEVRFAPFLNEKARKKALETFKVFQEIDKDINYVYAGYKNKMLLINNYIPPAGFDPTIRPWYQAAIKSFPNISQGLPYREIKTKEWLVSVSKALVDNNGKIIGVVSIDTSMDKIIKKLNEKKFLNIFNFILSKNGLIIISHNKFNLNKNFFRENKIDKKIFNKPNGFFEYYTQGEKLAYFNKLQNLGWIIVSEIDKKNIFSPIIKKIFLLFLIVSFLSVTLGFFMTMFITKEIINSLYNLHNNIQSIINNEQFKKTKSPFVEINEIYENIENLTQNALYKKNKELEKLNKKLEEMAIKDKLTNLYNRYKFNEELVNEINKYRRYKTPFCLIMFDVDYFKKINDNFGHDVGDKVLKEIARITKQTVRSTDVPARWGGEEFMILCPNTKLEKGIKIAERLRKAIENHDFGIDKKVTISVGVAEYNNEKMEMKDLLKAVDEKLYQAKKSGRNKTIY
ncbi:conserved hypothetical protein [Lebetimonas natsushimae]|uniref:diguanylate cyclase n=1 Tax=Lebetimonas natsushimae TaxID=1936991 RepID=A0A292YDE4_9BACT|nr:sensor domain-containing diguanylate cyclase [Lebetimonas natsushimae]GAX87423.1 conserved hypothetical protein [Lebetimonas natsushimae]